MTAERVCKYYYESLPPSDEHHRGTIRVLCLAHAEDWSSPLLGDIRCVTLDEAKNQRIYEALSYTWGNPKQTDTIQIGDHGTLGIAENLSHALRQLRSLKKCAIWVDAICINQQDAEERSMQVQLMPDIYACATRVLVWLGQATNEEEVISIFDFLEQLRMVEYEWEEIPRRYPPKVTDNEEDANSDYEWINRAEELNWRIYMTRERQASEGIVPITGEMLHKFLTRPWFSRRWVLQEIIYATKEHHTQSQEIHILWGKHEVHWKHFCNLFRAIKD